MSDNPEVAKAHQEIATRNAQNAVNSVEELRANYDKRILHLEQLIATLYNKHTLLEQKYHLLLTQRFNGGSTAPSDGD